MVPLQVATSVTALPLLAKWFPSILVFELYVVLSLLDLLPWAPMVPQFTFPPLKLSHWDLLHCAHLGLMFLYLLDFHKQSLKNFSNIPQACTWRFSHFHYIVLREVYTWNHYVFKYVFRKLFQFFFLPMGNKIVYHKGWKLRRQVFNQHN
jgi:hypothetical protein